MTRAAAPRRLQLLQWIEGRLPALTRLKRAESPPIRLDRHRIYVLPTRFGLLFAAVLLTMAVGALNYNNNPALLLTCLLGAAAFQSVFGAHRALDRLTLAAVRAEPCHAGETLTLRLDWQIAGRPRHALHVQREDCETDFHLDVDGSTRIECPAPRRGWQACGRLRLSSEYPFGLFEVWSWLHPDFRALIYPRLEADPPPLPHAGGTSASAQTRASGDELASLRDYRAGDPVRHIAWKASARHAALLVREFEQLQGQQVTLEFARLHGLDFEARIARLASWVCQAESARLPYTLILPEARIGPAIGAEHRHACLRALALLPGAAA
jgi:uncharacterized protein (DUF58 family)